MAIVLQYNVESKDISFFGEIRLSVSRQTGRLLRKLFRQTIIALQLNVKCLAIFLHTIY